MRVWLDLKAKDTRMTFRTLRSEDGDGGENVAKKVNSRCFSLHRDYSKSLTLSNVGEPPEVEFLRTISKFRKREEISSSLVYFLCTSWCTCKIVVLLIKPFAFVAFPLPSPSSYLKVPNGIVIFDWCSSLWPGWEAGECLDTLVSVPYRTNWIQTHY